MAPTAPLPCLLAVLLAVQGRGSSLRLQKDPAVGPLELKAVFRRFQIQYNRSYPDPEEYARRLDIFAHNLAWAQRLQEEDPGNAKFGVTQFSDLTEEEFRRLYGNQGVARVQPPVSRMEPAGEWGQRVPSSCDWRKMTGGLSPVRNQGKCSSCWAIAAAGNLEALWSIYGNGRVEVSVQEILDCNRCGNSCQGGFVWDAFMTILRCSGLVSENKYPYQGNFRPERCQANKNKRDRKPVAWIQDFVMVQKDEDKMAEYLATHGPITVTINMKLLNHVLAETAPPHTGSSRTPGGKVGVRRATSGCSEGTTPVASPSTLSLSRWPNQGKSPPSPVPNEPAWQPPFLMLSQWLPTPCPTSRTSSGLNKPRWHGHSEQIQLGWHLGGSTWHIPVPAEWADGETPPSRLA